MLEITNKLIVMATEEYTKAIRNADTEVEAMSFCEQASRTAKALLELKQEDELDDIRKEVDGYEYSGS